MDMIASFYTLNLCRWLLLSPAGCAIVSHYHTSANRPRVLVLGKVQECTEVVVRSPVISFYQLIAIGKTRFWNVLLLAGSCAMCANPDPYNTFYGVVRHIRIH